ncbi:MAG: cytochrome c biogenesis protein ResB, partial [Proteobacteria bacterium]|nr:cytochrome c biogenesis protein ResB [Pseudomonadota bacterium]
MTRLLSRLASLRLTLGLLLALAIVAGVGSFLPQGLDAGGFGARYPRFGPFLLALGFDHFYT